MPKFINGIILIFITLLLVTCKKEKNQNYLIETGPLALTFDDGPDSIYTPQILDILKEKNVKATFFLIGKRIKHYPKIAQRIAREGHAIGNHTYTHLFLPHGDLANIKEQIENTQHLIDSICGKSVKIFRPPWGEIDKTQVTEIQKLGYRIVLWDIDSRDYDTLNTPHSIIQQVVSKRNKNKIILMHSSDYSNEENSREPTVIALPKIINDLHNQGFYFETIPELLRIKQ